MAICATYQQNIPNEQPTDYNHTRIPRQQYDGQMYRKYCQPKV